MTATVKPVALVLGAVGLLAVVGMVAGSNARSVAAEMRHVGALGFLAVIGMQLALSSLLGIAWWLVAPGQGGRRLAGFIWSSLMAEAAANVLPFSQVAAAAIATRAAVLSGVAPSVALGSNIADVTLEVIAQTIFTLAGILVLAVHLNLIRAGGPLLAMCVAGLAVGAGLAGLLLATETWGLPAIVLLGRRMGVGRGAAAVTHVLEQVQARPGRLWAGLGVHLAAWFATVGATWLILVFIGRPLPLGSVLAIESLLFAIRNAAFFAPLSLGVQEGAYALLGPLFGLPIEAALALSLLKRARDISIGIPMLLSWQAAELRRRLRHRRMSAAKGAISVS